VERKKTYNISPLSLSLSHGDSGITYLKRTPINNRQYHQCYDVAIFHDWTMPILVPPSLYLTPSAQMLSVQEGVKKSNKIMTKGWDWDGEESSGMIM